MPTLSEFRETVRGDIEDMVKLLDPGDDVFPHLMIPREDVTDPSGKPVMVVVHCGEFFESGQRGKDVFVKIALPLLIAKFKAERIAFTSPVWMGLVDASKIADPAERERLLKLVESAGVNGLPPEYKREGVMVRIADREREISAFANLDRHPGAAPTLEWDVQKEALFNAPEALSDGRMHNGFLVEAFSRARSLTPAVIEIAEHVLGMSYWQPNPDDTPELFKPKP